jgi:hypothetical protein
MAHHILFLVQTKCWPSSLSGRFSALPTMSCLRPVHNRRTVSPIRTFPARPLFGIDPFVIRTSSRSKTSTVTLARWTSSRPGLGWLHYGERSRYLLSIDSCPTLSSKERQATDQSSCHRFTPGQYMLRQRKVHLENARIRQGSFPSHRVHSIIPRR